MEIERNFQIYKGLPFQNKSRIIFIGYIEDSNDGASMDPLNVIGFMNRDRGTKRVRNGRFQARFDCAHHINNVDPLPECKVGFVW